jgi:hypothetical protein
MVMVNAHGGGVEQCSALPRKMLATLALQQRDLLIGGDASSGGGAWICM